LSKPLILLNNIYFLKELARVIITSIIGGTALNIRVSISFIK